MIAELDKIAEESLETFGKLSAEQINWKPRADAWSVGQCFDHLIKTNEAFDPQLDALLGENRKQTFWQSYSPLTGFFGNFLLKSLANDERKVKTPSKSIIPPSEVPADIIARFVAHQKEFVRKIDSLEGVDLNKTVVTSPFLKLMTYRLETAFEIAVVHEKRHFRQAQRVTESEGFPK